MVKHFTVLQAQMANYKVKKSVKVIDDGAFYKNDNIKSIYLPDSVKKSEMKHLVT